MDLVSVHPIFNLYNQAWPILSVPPTLPPAKFVENGMALDSMVGPGTIISGATIRRSVVSENVRAEAGASVEGSVIMPGVRIGRNAVVRNAILDKNVIVPDGATVGINLEADRAAYTVTASGITVVGKGITITR
jgi:glucose-1-phosphate adenylyltransferase